MPPEDDRNHAMELFRTALEEKLGSRRFRNWFAASAKFTHADGVLTVQVCSPYLLKFIQKQFHELLGELAAAVFGPAIRIIYEAGKPVSLRPSQAEGETAGPPVSGVARRVSARPAPEPSAGKPRRSAEFGHFVVGPCNDLAFTAARRVADSPTEMSPVYLQGGVGVGKTHLLEGAQRQLRREFPTLQTVLITAEQFTNYFTQALQARTLPSFRHRFRSVDVLLVDDVDFFDGKRAVQEEFLHTVKRLEEGHRQLMVTAARHPRLLTKTCDELVTRFCAGLICRIDSPDDATRLKIVQEYAARLHLNAAPAALEFVASRFKDNVRELEGAVNVLSAWSGMTGQRVTPHVTREVLARLHRDCLRVVRLEDIEHAVGELYSIPPSDLRSDSRRQSVAQPRMLAMYLARRLTQAAYSEIGQHFGGRNHSTVISAERRVREHLSQGKTVRIGGEEWTIEDLLSTLEDRIRAV